MLDQLKWEILEHHRDNSHLCLLLKIVQNQVHVPTFDILSACTHYCNKIITRKKYIGAICKNRCIPIFILSAVRENQSLDTCKSRI